MQIKNAIGLKIVHDEVDEEAWRPKRAVPIEQVEAAMFGGIQ